MLLFSFPLLTHCRMREYSLVYLLFVHISGCGVTLASGSEQLGQSKEADLTANADADVTGYDGGVVDDNTVDSHCHCF